MGRAGTSNRWWVLAVQSRARGAEVRVCAPPDFAELLAGVGVPAAQFDTVAAASEDCDAPVATGVMPTGVRR
jgi:vancomycin aglycone glucosyltransferase